MRTIAVALAVAFFTASGATAAFVVTSANIKNGTIQPIDLSAKTKRVLRSQRGPRGTVGPPGAQGVAGPPGIQQITEYVAVKILPPGGIDTVVAYCPTGMNPVSGGTTFISGGGEIFIDRRSASGWAAGGDNFNEIYTSAELRAYVYCSPNITIAGAPEGPTVEQLLAARRAAHLGS